MFFFRSFSYRGKAIIKGIRNIIGIGYSITIVKGEYGRYMGGYSFSTRYIRNENVVYILYIRFIFISKLWA